MNRIILPFFLLVAVVLAACSSGGGKSSSSEGSSEFSLTFQPRVLVGESNVGELAFAEIPANFIGRPSGQLYVHVTLPDVFESFSYLLESNRATLMFDVNRKAPVGVYSGELRIDLCYDQSCQRTAGPTNILPFQWAVNRIRPEILIESENPLARYEPESRSLMVATERGQKPAPVVLTLVPPSRHTSVMIDEQLINDFNAEIISPTEITLHPPVTGSREWRKNYFIRFSSPNNNDDATPFYFNVLLNTFALTEPKLELDPIVAVVGRNHPFFNRDYVGITNRPAGTETTQISKTYISGNGWLKTSHEPTSLDFSLEINDVEQQFGLWEAELTVDAEGVEQESVRVFAIAPAQPLFHREVEFDVGQLVNREEMNGVSYVEAETTDQLDVMSLSSWIKNVTKTNEAFGWQTFEFEVDIDELKLRRLPVYEPLVGYIKVQSVSNPDVVDIAKVSIDFHIPDVYYIEPQVVPAGAPFEITAYNENPFRTAAPSLVYIKNINDQSEDLGQEYVVPELREGPDSQYSFDMPSLAAGEYTLNFSGEFYRVYKPLKLTVQ